MPVVLATDANIVMYTVFGLNTLGFAAGDDARQDAIYNQIYIVNVPLV